MDIQQDSDVLIVVDMQNDFAEPDGALYVGGARNIVPTINKLIEAFQSADAEIIYTKDWHPEDSLHFESNGGDWPKHCVQESWGAELHEKLKTSDELIVIKKGTQKEHDGYSAFRNKNLETGEIELTELNELLKTKESERVFICGVATEYCIKQTALDSAKSGYDTYVIENAIKAVKKNQTDETEALQVMNSGGAALVTLE